MYKSTYPTCVTVEAADVLASLYHRMAKFIIQAAKEMCEMRFKKILFLLLESAVVVIAQHHIRRADP